MRLRSVFLILFFLLAGDVYGQTVLNLPRIISNPDTFTGIAISNPTAREASVTFAPFNADGTALESPRTVTIPAGGQYARQFSEIFPTAGTFNGWVQATSATPGLTGFFLNANFAVTDVDGAGSASLSSDFILPIASEASPTRTEITLVNVNTEAVAITATIYGSDGTVLATKNLQLNGRALIRQTLRPIFGDVDLSAASHVRIRSDRPILGHEVIADFEIPQIAVRRETIAVAGQPATSAQTYVMPQFVAGGGWSSYLSLVNGSGLSQEVTVTAYKEDGTPFELPANPKRVSLAGNASLKTTVEQLFEFPLTRLSVGWIEVRSPLGYIVGNIGFGNVDTPSFALVSAIDAAQASRLNVYSHVAEGGGFFTGLTVVNPGREPANVEFFTLRADGTTVGRLNFTVGPNQRVGKLFRELLPAAYEQLGGWAFVRSSQPVVAAVLFGATNGFGLANVPAQLPIADFIPPAQSTAAITGTIHQDIVGAGGVTVTLTGPVTATKTTDASGLFAFGQLPPGQYKVAVSKAGAQFFPAERTVTLVRENIDEINFDAVGIAPADAPVITFLTPASIFGGTSAFNITVLGGNFNQTSVVRINDQQLQTTFINATELRAAVPAGLLRNPGVLTVTVLTPPPGGGGSNRADLTVNALPINPFIEGRTNVGPFPAGVAIHPVRKIALITSQSGDSVSIIDLRNNLISMGEVKVGRSPAEGIAISVERDLALVANVGDDNVSVIDLRTNQETKKIKVEDFPTGVAINPITNRAVVVNGESDSISIIDLNTLEVTGTIKVGRRPASVAINTRTNVAVVTNRRGNDVSIVDLGTGTVVGNVPVGQYPRGVAVNPNNNTAIVANANSNNVSIVNLAARSVIATIDVGVGPTGVAIHLPTSSAVVTNSGATNGDTTFGSTNTASIINLDTRQIVETVPVGTGAFGVDIDPEMQKAVIANYASNDITVVRLPNPKPSVTSVEPRTFPAGGGAFTITVRGTGFLATSVVTLNGQPLPTTFVTSTELRAEVSAAMLQQLLQPRAVELLDGKKSGEVFQQVTQIDFNVGVSNPGPGGGESPPPSDPAVTRIQPQNASPVLISMDPTQIVAGTGDLRLTVSGNNFNATSQLIFGSTPHSPVTVSATGMTFIIPAGDLRPGPVSISIMNPPPGGGTTPSLTFTVLESMNPAPAITMVTPAELPAGSPATQIRIAGSGFMQTGTVAIEGNTMPATITPTAIELTIPANLVQTPATLRGLITNPGPGGGAATFNINVLNPAPVVSSFSPQNAVVGASSIELRILGSRFGSSSVVTVEGTPVPTRALSSEELRATLAAAILSREGRFRIAVVNPSPGGGSADAGEFVVAAEPNNPVPAITALNPAFVLVGQANSTITVTGTGFAHRAVVQVDGAAVSTTFVNETTLRFVMPAAPRAGNVNITASNPPPGGGTSPPFAITVQNPVPVLSSISPTSGTSGTTITLSVTGSGFVQGSTINFAGQSLPTTFVNSTTLTATVGLITTGGQQVTVTTPGPGGGTSSNIVFEVSVAPNPIPSITSASPSFVGVGVASPVEIRGSGFVAGAIVTVDGTAVGAVVQSSSSILATLPAMSAGNHTIVVSNPAPGGGPSNGFTVTAITSPMITSVSPGIVAPGSASFTMTITGVNFGTASSAVTVAVGSMILNPTSVTSSVVAVPVPDSALASETTLNVAVRINGVASNTAALSVRHSETFATGLSNLKDVVVNAQQEVFVANAGTGTIVKVSPFGVVSTFAGGFSVGGPSGLALSAGGDLYVADNLQGTIAKVTAAGSLTTFATGLSKPNDILFDAAGNLLVANSGDATIKSITPAGVVSTAATLSGLTPFGLAVSGADLYVSDYASGQIVRLRSGEPSTVLAYMNRSSDGLAIDSAGRLFLGNGVAGTLDRIDTDGRVAHLATGMTASGPVALSIDSAGVLFAAFNDRVVRFASRAVTRTAAAPFVSRMEPSFSTPGRTLSASILGSGLANTSAVTFSSSKAMAVVNSGAGTNAFVPVDVTVLSTASPESLTFTATTPLGITNASTFDIVGVPTITAITPTSTTAESDAFTLTVTGSNFHSDAMVQFGSAMLAPSTRSASQLTVTVPTSAVLTIEALQVAVKSGGSTSNQVPFVVKTPVTSVTISPVAPTLTSFGATHQFQATAKNAEGETVAGKSFAWASSSTSIASVDGAGLVTAAGNGEVTITATVDGVSATTTLKVDQLVETISISPTSATLSSIDATQPFSFELKDARGNIVTNKTITWSSTAPAVATVDSTTGIATAVADGTAAIKATVGDKSASAALTVAQAVASIDVSPSTATLESLNVTQLFTAVARDAKGKAISGKTFAWSSDKADLVSINSTGVATAVADTAGAAITIRAKVDGKEGTASLVVGQKVVTVQVTAESTTIASLGATQQFKATIKDANNQIVTGKTIEWSSDKSETATVDVNGLVKAVGNGSAVIKAKVNGASGELTVVVDQAVQSIAVSPSTKTLTSIGDTQDFTVVLKDALDNLITGKTVVWSSSNADVATIDSASGIATAKKDGTSEIKATVGTKTATASVTVAQAISTVQISPDTKTFASLQETATFTVTVKDAKGNTISGKTIEWTSESGTIASVDANGLIKALANGSTTIKATVGDKTATAAITVAQSVHTVTIAPAARTFASFKESQSFTVTVKDALGNAMEKTLSWTSSKPDVATVASSGAASGLAVAVADGEAVITATAGDKSATATITVAQAVSKVTVIPANHTFVAKDETLEFKASAEDALGNSVLGKTVTWTSSAAAAATVNAAGLVTAVNDGASTITASVGGKSGTAAVTVAQAIASVALSPDTKTLVSIGETLTLALTVKDSQGNTISGSSATWISSHPSFATVNNGLVEAKANGSTTITATVGGKSATAHVVVAQAVDSVEIVVDSGSSITVDAPKNSGGRVLAPTLYRFEANAATASPIKLTSLGDTLQFKAVVKDARGNPISGKSVTWTSDKPDAAEVDATGKATARRNGSVKVTATVEAKSGALDLAVEQVVASVVVEPSAKTFVSFGETQPFKATPLDARGNPVEGKTPVWSSASPVTVDTAGVVTAGTADGETTLTATVDGKSAAAAVKVAQEVASITISPDTKTLTTLGTVQDFTVIARDARGNIANKTVEWSTTQPALASINASGRATAHGNGRVGIVAKVGNKTGLAALIIAQGSARIELAKGSHQFAALKRIERILAKFFDTNGNEVSKSIVWSSDNEAVAIVNPTTGDITAVGNGTATITASADGVSASLTIVVSQVLHGVVISEVGSGKLKAFGHRRKFVAQAVDPDGYPISGKKAAWKSSDEGIASVDTEGEATAKFNGSVTLTAFIDDKSATAALNVDQEVDSIVSLTGSGRLKALHRGRQYKAVDANGNAIAGKTIVWSSSADGIATVDTAGNAKAKGNGLAKIFATVDGKSVSADLEVSQEVTSVEISADGAGRLGALKKKRQFTAKAKDPDGYDIAGKTVTWATSDSTTASIDSNGVATSEKNGKARVKATIDGISSAEVDIDIEQVTKTVVISGDNSKIPALNRKRKFTAKAKDENGFDIEGKIATWSSTNRNAAEIDTAGEITAKGNGGADVKATIDGIEGTLAITVDQVVHRLETSDSGKVKALNRTRQFKAVDEDGNPIVGKTISWSPSSTDIATVDSTGIAKAKGNGAGKIKATVDGKTVEADFEVSQEVSSIEVTADGTGRLGALKKQRKFTAKAKDPDGFEISGKAITWKTSDATIASLGTDGTATAEKNGKVTVRASIDGVESQPLDLEIQQVTSKVEIAGDNGSIPALHRKRKFTAQAKDENGFAIEGKSAAWSSSNPDGIPVDASGEITARGNGNSTLKAVIDGIEGTLSVAVNQVLHRVESAETGKIKALNRSRSFKALDEDGNEIVGKTIEWSSAAPGTATVSSTGVATAKGNGATGISAKVDGKTITANLEVLQETFSVAVKSTETGKISALNKKRKFTVEAKDPDGFVIAQTRATSWASSNGTIASIDSQGELTSLKNGALNVTVTFDGIASTALAVEVSQEIDRIEASDSALGTSNFKSFGEKRKFVAKDANGVELQKTITWASSDTTVFAVESGEVVSKSKNSSASISATVDGKSVLIPLTVSQVAASITIKDTSLSLPKIGRTKGLTAEAKDALGYPITNKSITWSSADSTTVTVDDKGLIKALKKGTTKVRASIDGVSADIEVAVD